MPLPAPGSSRRLPVVFSAAANLMSVICTCKRAGVEPYAYLLDVIRRLPSMKTTELAQLLPTEWKRAHEALAEPTSVQL